MNIDALNEATLHFVAVKPNRFVIDGKGYSELQVLIEDIMPVRKLFDGRKLLCYSSDGKKGKSGRHCALCRDRHKCHRRMRMMVMVQNVQDKPMPALLEINQQSFEPLKEFVESIGEKKVASTLVRLSVGKNEKEALTILFAAIF
jgi:hypothetical protein